MEKSDPEAWQPSPDDLATRRGPNRVGRMKKLAAKGDVDGILAMLKNSPMPSADYEDALREIRAAFDVLGKSDPAKLCQMLFSKMLSLQGSLLIRAQLHVDTAIAENDRRYPGRGNLPESVVEEWFPRLSRIQNEVRECARCAASVAHTFAIANEGTAKQRKKSGNVVRFDVAKGKVTPRYEAAGE